MIELSSFPNDLLLSILLMSFVDTLSFVESNIESKQTKFFEMYNLPGLNIDLYHKEQAKSILLFILFFFLNYFFTIFYSLFLIFNF